MAKSDSFFIRAIARTSGANYVPSDIDLGSFVNLGVKSSTLLRIHNVSIQYSDDSGPEHPIYANTATPATVCWQLTTQQHSTMVTADDKSLVSSGRIQMFGDGTNALGNDEIVDMNPQNWKNGYLIGVDTLFFAVDTVGTVASGEVDCAIVLECTLENATQASATALALSQQ